MQGGVRRLGTGEVDGGLTFGICARRIRTRLEQSAHGVDAAIRGGGHEGRPAGGGDSHLGVGAVA